MFFLCTCVFITELYCYRYVTNIFVLFFEQDLIPHMAQHYDFDYELITYKWPTWLHKQKEKQRIIWAYKILFLDVIFPLSLEKANFPGCTCGTFIFLSC